jgi:hypothetical protein
MLGQPSLDCMLAHVEFLSDSDVGNLPRVNQPSNEIFCRADCPDAPEKEDGSMDIEELLAGFYRRTFHH